MGTKKSKWDGISDNLRKATLNARHARNVAIKRLEWITLVWTGEGLLTS